MMLASYSVLCSRALKYLRFVFDKEYFQVKQVCNMTTITLCMLHVLL